MSANRYPVSVYVAQFINRIDGGFGICHKLVYKRIVGFCIAFANNRESGIIKQADERAALLIENMLRDMGYENIEIVFAAA